MYCNSITIENSCDVCNIEITNGNTLCPSCIESEECCENEKGDWEPVYTVTEGLDELVGDVPELQMFKTKGELECTYYCTFGGGPEGGYIIQPKWTRNNGAIEFVEDIYKVKRGWLVAFNVEKIGTDCYEVERYDEAQIQEIRITNGMGW